MELIKCNDLSIGYNSAVIKNGINFSINAGDYVCIVGENGSGKSTFIKTLLGLVKPVSGNFICSETSAIGYLPQQNPSQKDFPATAMEIILSGNLARKKKKGFLKNLFYSADDKKRAEDAIKRLHIEKLKKRCFRELSGGQQQKVLLARALCAADQLLLLDEPVTGLDPESTEDMYQLISELNRNGMTIIMITHDLDPVKKYASHYLRFTSKDWSFHQVEKSDQQGGDRAC